MRRRYSNQSNLSSERAPLCQCQCQCQSSRTLSNPHHGRRVQNSHCHQHRRDWRDSLTGMVIIQVIKLYNTGKENYKSRELRRKAERLANTDERSSLSHQRNGESSRADARERSSERLNTLRAGSEGFASSSRTQQHLDIAPPAYNDLFTPSKKEC